MAPFSLSDLMDKNQKRKFVRDLTASIQTTVLASVEKMPENWDGHQIRVYLADKFRDAATTSTLHRSRSAMRRYNNDVTVLGL